MYYTIIAKKPVYHFEAKEMIITFEDRESAVDFMKSGDFLGKTTMKAYKTRNMNHSSIFKDLNDYNDALKKLDGISHQIMFLANRNKLQNISHTKHQYHVYKQVQGETKFKLGDKVYPISKYASIDVSSTSSRFQKYFNIENYQGTSWNSNWINEKYVITKMCLGEFKRYVEDELEDYTEVVYYCVGVNTKTILVTTEEHISILTKEQFDKAEFNSIHEANLGKWDKDSKDLNKKFPKELLRFMYDKNCNTQFGSSMTRASIKYPYIPAEYMNDNIPLLLGWEQNFDGGVEMKQQIAEHGEGILVHFNDLHKTFKNNKFVG